MAKNSKTFTKLALSALALGTAFTAANDAMALETGQCGSSESIRAELRAEGQVPLIVAYRSIPSQPKNYFSTNSNLSLGYQFEEQNGQICIAGKYRDIRLNNDPNVAIPTWATIAPQNSPFNNFLNTYSARENGRVVFGALAFNAAGETTSKIVLAEGNGDQFVTNRGVTIAGAGNGEYGIAMHVENIAVTPNYTAMANNTNTSVTTVLASNLPR